MVLYFINLLSNVFYVLIEGWSQWKNQLQLKRRLVIQAVFKKTDWPRAGGAAKRLLFEIPPGELKPKYLSAPYPCHILFKTTGGAHWITLGTIPKLTSEREAEPKRNSLICERFRDFVSR
jgi:hypothetical protein